MSDTRPSPEALAVAREILRVVEQRGDLGEAFALARELDAFAARARASEREACAITAEDADVALFVGHGNTDDAYGTLGNAARAIRARSAGCQRAGRDRAAEPGCWCPVCDADGKARRALADVLPGGGE